MMLSLRHIKKTFFTEYSDVQAVRDVSLDIEKGDFFTLLGPSGCGKTTILRCIAGLETPDDGEIVMDGQVVYSGSKGQVLPVYKRPIGVVFQSYAIWPHMNVFDNVAYPLQHGQEERLKKQEIRAKVLDALSLVRLDGLEDRPAPQLSGGQQQRVALARALVKHPRLLLLDEPLSNLDAKLREAMRYELRDLIHQLGITTLYVTHDQLEALVMSDQVAIIQDGKLIQVGAGRDIYNQPTNTFTASFVGAANLLGGTFREDPASEAGGVTKAEIGPIFCTAAGEIKDGQTVRVAMRPEHIDVLDSKTASTRGSVNVFEGDIESLDFQGDSMLLRVRVGTELLQVKVISSREMHVGEHIYLSISPKHCRALPL